jgi:hypothetical protein
MRPLAHLLSKQNQLLGELPATITANVWVVRGKAWWSRNGVGKRTWKTHPCALPAQFLVLLVVFDA